ncbi:MAG: PHP domain-containing protein [Anaerolineaceae bacterium]|nr:PHP domain-containing protein [Anaerolineaceae bacterium]
MNDSKKLIKADFHVHTSCSRRVTASPEEMYESAKAKGLDKIAITDHNTLKGALNLAEKDPDYVIVGEEITWDAPGEIIGLFLKEDVPEGKTAEYTLDALQDQNAFIFIPHPFAPFHFFCPPDNILRIADRIDAIEIRNGRNFNLLNSGASLFSSICGIQGICGSDAHKPQDTGRAGMILPDFANADELRNSIKLAKPFGLGLSLINSLKLLKKVF